MAEARRRPCCCWGGPLQVHFRHIAAVVDKIYWCLQAQYFVPAITCGKDAHSHRAWGHGGSK